MRISRLTAVAVLLAAARPGVLLAAEGGSGIFSLNLGLLVWTWVLFLLTLGVLAWKAFPAISRGLEARQARIQEAIDSARNDRDEARRLLDEHRRQLDEARHEAKEILAQGRVAGDRLREEILSEARKEHEDLLARARKEMAREREDMLESVRTEAVDLALAAAERLLRQKLDEQENRRLVQDYMEGLD